MCWAPVSIPRIMWCNAHVCVWPDHACKCWKWPTWPWIMMSTRFTLPPFVRFLATEKIGSGWSFCGPSRLRNNMLEYSMCSSITYPIPSVFIGSIIYARSPPHSAPHRPIPPQSAVHLGPIVFFALCGSFFSHVSRLFPRFFVFFDFLRHARVFY